MSDNARARRCKPERAGQNSPPTSLSTARAPGGHARSARTEQISQRTSFSTARLRGSKSGGARRDRTDDLLLAKQALSQLSYGPDRDQIPAIAIRALA